MTEQTYDDEMYDTDEQDAPEQQPQGNDGIRSLRKKAKDYDTVASERDRLRRELAFTKAGLDGDSDPRLAYFVNGYTGELTRDAIRAEAARVGFIEPDAPAEPVETPAERVVNSAAGAAPARAGVLTPADAASWSPDKFARLRQANPDAYEALLRGEPVSGVAF